MKCRCKMCKGEFEIFQVYIAENGEYICKSCQQEHKLELADLELLKRIGSKDSRNC